MGDIYLGTATAQFLGNPVPVVVAGNVVKAEQAVAQHDGITGFGVGVLEQPVKPARMGGKADS